MMTMTWRTCSWTEHRTCLPQPYMPILTTPAWTQVCGHGTHLQSAVIPAVSCYQVVDEMLLKSLRAVYLEVGQVDQLTSSSCVPEALLRDLQYVHLTLCLPTWHVVCLLTLGLLYTLC